MSGYPNVAKALTPSLAGIGGGIRRPHRPGASAAPARRQGVRP